MHLTRKDENVKSGYSPKSVHVGSLDTGCRKQDDPSFGRIMPCPFPKFGCVQNSEQCGCESERVTP